MITIKDNGEKLVDLNKYCPEIIISDKIKNRAFLRKTVADKLNEAVKYLPNRVTFIIESAWRTARDQKIIYKNFWHEVKKKKPNWIKAKIKRYVDKFVASPGGKYISGHMTGGAFDIRLVKNGRKLPMRSKKLNYEENSKSHQPKLPKNLQGNRKIMFQALEKAGFANCTAEFWHWSYGDIWWAKYNNRKTAMYGKIDKL